MDEALKSKNSTTAESTRSDQSTSTEETESTTEDETDDEQFPWDSPEEVPVPEDAGTAVYESDIPLEKMALENFPAPEEITRLVENRELDGRGNLPDTDIIDPEQGVFLTLTAKEVYDYLVELQKKTDHWLNNEIKYNIQRQVIGQSHGMTENLKLEHYDKKWLALTEKERRMEATDYEWEAVPDSRGWQELPNDEEADWNTAEPCDDTESPQAVGD
ncbi:hypothetical protein [Salinibaculum rarum]|uniref:hypothetical protein n=1 Tax=Salinibaculum rarum TaxID=3058903 RepID=UPI00265FA896|nr:hypothetical protein [Salinibaculum sp. KK48]